VPDPYCWPGTSCLRNRLGLRDPAELAVVEGRIVGLRDAQLAREPLPGEYHLEHLKAFHRALFRDVYDWAGETRTVDIHRPDSTFCHWRYVDEEVSRVLYELTRDDLTGHQRRGFVQRFAYYYGELNARHPFREGNGRTQRAFLRQLAAAAGWHVDWSGVSREQNVAASADSLRTGRSDQLVLMLDPIVSQI
jgi:cell filamentation protein